MIKLTTKPRQIEETISITAHDITRDNHISKNVNAQDEAKQGMSMI